MDELVHAAWQKALKAKGREGVLSELRKRPGRPNDIVEDIIFQEPYPTRAFCQQWCNEQDNKIFSVSWHTYGAAAALILFVVCVLMAVQSWNAADVVASTGPLPALGAPDGGSSSDRSSSNAIPSMTGDTSASSAASSSVAASSAASADLTICAYQSYQTAQCNTSH